MLSSVSGFRLTLDKQNEYARELLPQLASLVGEPLVTGLAQRRSKHRSWYQRTA